MIYDIISHEYSDIKPSYQTNIVICCQFRYQIDTRVFRWLHRCKKKDDREQVDVDLIHFKPLVQAVLNEQFLQVLSYNFESKATDNDDDSQPDTVLRKRKKIDTNQKESRLTKNT